MLFAVRCYAPEVWGLVVVSLLGAYVIAASIIGRVPMWIMPASLAASIPYYQNIRCSQCLCLFVSLHLSVCVFACVCVRVRVCVFARWLTVDSRA